MLAHTAKSTLIAIIAAVFSPMAHYPAAAPLSARYGPVSACVGFAKDRTWGNPASDFRPVEKLAGPFAGVVVDAAQKARVSPKLVAAVLNVENGGNLHGATHRVSPAGAVGVMQLMPTTAWSFLHVNPWNARQNIEGGAKYLAWLLRQFHGDQRLALMAYNAGPNAIASGLRPVGAVDYAQRVLRLVETV
jgi:soluble lytic murein transglycosylase-like protein